MKKIPKYEIVKVEDLSFSTCVRVQYRIRVEKLLSLRELADICGEVIEKQKAEKPVNAISFLFYLPGSDTDFAQTAGMAEWAPNGKWVEADTVKAGDYSQHALVVHGEAGKHSLEVREAENT